LQVTESESDAMVAPTSSPTQLVARAGIRAGDQDVARLAKDGWNGWVSAQLALPDGDARDVADTISKVKLRIEYEAEDGFKALKEERRLTSLHKPIRELWHLTDWQKKMAWEERIRPSNELLAATMIRVTMSDAQLRESVTDFWRDHFSVNRDAVEDVAIALPTYDQDVLRPHALGNFREMLEAVATSTAMLAYLNNASSKASPANENYARELMELHGLGAGAYLHAAFDKWRDVPGAIQGKPEGFIDEDVYEAARAFTGWTYGGGQYISEGFDLPRTGEFMYTEQWHDPYQKRVLGIEFDSHLGPMADGRKVLDLVAFHPATARNICKRLCQRFIADAPPEELIESAARVFIENRAAKNQMAKVIEHILLSPEFASAAPRLQRPLFLFASMQRSAGVVLPTNPDNTWILEGMGQRLYGWHTPAGHPLVSAYWQSPGLLIRRWRAMADIWSRIMAHDSTREWPTMTSFAEDWTQKLGLDAAHQQRLLALLTKENGSDERKMTFAESERWGNSQMLATLTASPRYQSV
jgi:uncharacterized protein (DUF1800 family)